MPHNLVLYLDFMCMLNHLFFSHLQGIKWFIWKEEIMVLKWPNNEISHKELCRYKKGDQLEGYPWANMVTEQSYTPSPPPAPPPPLKLGSGCIFNFQV